MDAWMESARRMMERYGETAVIPGNSTLAGLEEYLRQSDVRSLAVFTGRHSADDSGAWGALLRGLETLDLPMARFREIPAEPDTATVMAMTGFLREIRPDAVMALGGGSVLDAAKAAYIVAQSGLELTDCFGGNRIGERFPGREFDRIIAIPTTSGTGSEVTQYANIVNRALEVKQLISDPVLVPKLAVLRAQFTASMPAAVTLATGCDALAHLLEGWLNVGQDANRPEVNEWARTGAALIVAALPRVLADAADMKAREAMQLAATLGGMTIRFKSTGLPHLASFSWFGRIPHGVAVARILPAAWRYYLGSAKVAERTRAIGAVFGGDTPEAVVAHYEAFLERCGVPRLADYPGLDAALMARTARSAGSNRMKLELAPRPVPLERSEAVLSGILEQAMRG